MGEARGVALAHGKEQETDEEHRQKVTDINRHKKSEQWETQVDDSGALTG